MVCVSRGREASVEFSLFSLFLSIQQALYIFIHIYFCMASLRSRICGLFHPAVPPFPSLDPPCSFQPSFNLHPRLILSPFRAVRPRRCTLLARSGTVLPVLTHGYPTSCVHFARPSGLWRPWVREKKKNTAKEENVKLWTWCGDATFVRMSPFHVAAPFYSENTPFLEKLNLLSIQFRTV